MQDYIYMIALKKLVELVPVDLHCSNLGKTNFFGAIIRSLALLGDRQACIDR